MLYLGIDQHSRQLTVSLRDEAGDVVLARQVSTQPEKVKEFFQQLTQQRLTAGESFLAVVEVCGFNDWLIRTLQEFRCHKVILIQPYDRDRRKTDRRDASALSEMLWLNRERLLHGKPVRGLRTVEIPTEAQQQDRRLSCLRQQAAKQRARLVNQGRHILRRHNLHWQIPTGRFFSLKAIAWMKQLTLPEIDRLEMDHILADLEQLRLRIKAMGVLLAKRCGVSEEAEILRTMPGIASFTAVALACRVGCVGRFKHAKSLANYWGLTPGSRNSGENQKRLGRITKAGSPMARWLLGQVVYKILRKDAQLRDWFKRLKRRRGSTVARVGVMRKVATIIWHMLSKKMSYAECRAKAVKGQGQASQEEGVEAS